MENKIFENEFMHKLNSITAIFIGNALFNKREIIKDRNKTKLELKIFFLVRIAHILQENFSKAEYNDILIYYHKKIINKEIELIDNISRTDFINERFEFHNNGIIELNQRQNIKDFLPNFDSYTTLLESVIFDYPLKKITEIKNEVNSNFFNPFYLVNKDKSSLDFLKLTNNYISRIQILSIESDKNKWNLNYKPIKFRYSIILAIIILSLIYYFLIR